MRQRNVISCKSLWSYVFSVLLAVSLFMLVVNGFEIRRAVITMPDSVSGITDIYRTDCNVYGLQIFYYECRIYRCGTKTWMGSVGKTSTADISDPDYVNPPR